MWVSSWNSQGKRVEIETEFKPYLYVKQADAKDAVSIYGEPLYKKEYPNRYERDAFVESYKKVYGCITPEQQFLIDNFHGQNTKKDFSIWPLKGYTLDIETFSEKGVPNVVLAEDPITLISVHDSLTNVFHTFGIGNDYVPKDSNVIYNFYPTELEMIKAFVRFWRKDFPDYISFWNGWGFDLPYLMNRINKLYEDEFACNRLSPVGRAWKRDNAKIRLGGDERVYDQFWTIAGIATIDYMCAYMKFCPDKRESYSLQNIAELELGSSKVDLEGTSISDLQLKDWTKFVDYNIQDVNIIIELDKKLKYMNLCRSLTNSGLCILDDWYKTSPIVTGLAVQEAKRRGQVIPTFHRDIIETAFEGGFVREPLTGFSSDIASIDGTSMYPITLLTLNASPETKIGKVIGRTEKNENIVELINGNKKHLTDEQLKQVVVKGNLSISKYGVLFSQDKIGIFPAFIDTLFKERVRVKNEMKKIDKQISKLPENHPDIGRLNLESEYLYGLQLCLKIQLNSIYGYLGEKHAPMFDIDLAASVTATCRECIKASTDLIDTSIVDGCKATPTIIYGDTDSVYFSIKNILKEKGISLEKDGKVNPEVVKIVQKIANNVNVKITEWAKNELNSIKPRYEFKVETICKRGVFLKKKHYILNVIWDEGIETDYFKYVGVEVATTKTPKKLKPVIKDVIEALIRNPDARIVNDKVADFWKIYKDFSIEDKAITSGIKNLEKFVAKTEGLKTPKGTPFHVKSAIFYNHMLKEMGIEGKYEKISSCNKTKIIRITPDKNTGIVSMSFKSVFPDEFKKRFVIDDAIMFEKTFMNPIQRILTAVGWRLKNPIIGESVDLFEFFGTSIPGENEYKDADENNDDFDMEVVDTDTEF